jgi:translation initiation factor IF-2
MASMRVHELAKEFGMTSKELLDKLQDLKIPAKNHASTLVEAYVDKIRKALGPEIAERQIALEEERTKHEAAEAAKKLEAEQAAHKAAEEAAHKAAMEERRRRDEEHKARDEEAARVKAEEDARRPVLAREEAPVAVVEAPVTVVEAAPPVEKPTQKPVKAVEPESSGRAGLEAAIAAERTRLETEETAKLNDDEEKRYRQMAVEAEELQRQKVLDEARAAVAAAAVEGGRKKKKHKKPVGIDAEEAAHH